MVLEKILNGLFRLMCKFFYPYDFFTPPERELMLVKTATLVQHPKNRPNSCFPSTRWSMAKS